MEDEEIKKPIIIDNGTGYIKAGFEGETEPKIVIPNQIGRPKLNGENKYDFYCGDDIKENREKLRLTSPIERGEVKNWDDMEIIFGHILCKLTDCQEEHNVLVSEPTMNPKSQKEKITQMMFETFNISGLYIANQGVLSLLSYGIYNGISVDSGEGITQFVPMYDGKVLPYAINRIDFGGKDLTEYMEKLLMGKIFPIEKEKEIAKDIKEKACYIPYNLEDEISKVESLDYKLPDGSSILIKDQRIECPEALFDPCLTYKDYDSIAKICNDSIKMCKESFQKELYNNILLTGGNTLFEGFEDRFRREIFSLAKPSFQEHVRIVRIFDKKERKFAVWIGGSLLSNILPKVEKGWITKTDYEENGSDIVHKKCKEFN